jgi:pre-mRNA-splicing factor 18
MDFLAAEISRKRKDLESKTTDSSGTKKFIRQKDILAEQERQYLEDQRRHEQERQAKAAAKLEETRKREEAARLRKEKLQKEKQDKLIPVENNEKRALSNDDVKMRFRELGEPIVLFGETDEERRIRLEDLEVKVTAELKRQARLEAVGAEDMPESESLENLTPDAEELKIKLSDIKKSPNILYEQLYRYFKVVCQEWSRSLEDRDPETKESPEGMEALKVHQQCLRDFRPLFKSLKRKVCVQSVDGTN